MKKSRVFLCSTALTALVSVMTGGIAVADQAGADNVFTLGQITVYGRSLDQQIEDNFSSLSSEMMWKFDRNNLTDAITLVPGVNVVNTGGSRNETVINVRGFNRFQVPLSLDGIRVYLPYDNRLDFSRFLTPDVSEIQVAKGYVSVLDGPGGMGGAINLVTRKPTKELEAEVRGSLSLDRDLGYGGYTTFGMVGSRQEKFYVQASGALNKRDHFSLSNKFTPTANEDGGEREKSDTRDWRVNVKAGFTPNATDEYSISYTRQEGSKNAPLHTTSPQAQAWSWPYWNIESIYFLSTTSFTDNLTLKTRLYYNTFNNLLRGFDDHTQTTQTSTAGRVFNSWYDDEAYGGSAQFDYTTDNNRLSVVFHYRRDEHVEYSQVFPTGFIEPPQKSVEDTFSVAIEDRLELSSTLSLTAGFSYDWRDLSQSDEFALNNTRNGGVLFGYPLVDADAWNAQGRLDWTPSADTSVHLSLSSRTRFPSLFERFSSRFGGATSNPDLKAERATNVEVGASKLFGAVRLEGNLFYSWVDDAIVSFPFIYNGSSVSQSRNVGKAKYYGVELVFAADLSDWLMVGGNYTYVHQDITDPSIATVRPVGVPKHKLFVYSDITPMDGLVLTPSIEAADKNWTDVPSGALYYKTGGRLIANFRAGYALNENVDVALQARNIFDKNYQLVDGYPQEGRNFAVNVRIRY